MVKHCQLLSCTMKHFLRKIYLSHRIKKTKGNGSLQKRLDKMSLLKKDGKSCYKKGKVHAKEMEKPKITKKRKCGFASVHQAKPASSKLKHRVEIKATISKPQEKRSLKKKSSGAERQHECSPLLKTGGSSKPTRKRKQNNKSKASFSEKNLRHGSQGTPKKPKFNGEVQNGKTVVKSGNHKRKNARTHECSGDGNNKNAHKKNPFKKQKVVGNTPERYKSNPKSNTRGRRGHGDCRNFTRYADPYAPKYAVSALNSYHEPLAGYSGYVQNVLLEPAYRSQFQSQNSSRYLGRDVLPVVQPYSVYYPSEYVQIAHDPYHSWLARAVQRDGGGVPLCTYVGGPLFPASQGGNPASYYQACSSYSGAYHNQQTYH